MTTRQELIDQESASLAVRLGRLPAADWPEEIASTVQYILLRAPKPPAQPQMATDQHT